MSTVPTAIAMRADESNEPLLPELPPPISAIPAEASLTVDEVAVVDARIVPFVARVVPSVSPPPADGSPLRSDDHTPMLPLPAAAPEKTRS